MRVARLVRDIGVIVGIPAVLTIGLKLYKEMQMYKVFRRITQNRSPGIAIYIITLCVILGVAAIAWPVLKNDGFPLDDSWIHQVIGRNAARFGIPGFAPGIATAGSTSTIWPWIIAFNYKFVSFIDPVVYLLIVNTVLLVSVIFVLYRFSIEDKLSNKETILVVAIPAITGNFVWLISTGMEHLLFIAAAFLASFFWLPIKSPPRLMQAMLSGALFGLAIEARPEAVAFLPVFLLAGWLLDKSRREVIAFIALSFLSIIIVVLNNLWTSHSALPNTFSGRMWLYFGGDTHYDRISLAVKLLQHWSWQVVHFFIGIDSNKNVLIYSFILVVICGGMFRLLRKKAWNTTFLILLAACNVATYCVFLPASGHGMRYLAMSLVFIFPLIGLGGLELVEWVLGKLKISDNIYPLSGTAVVVAIGLLALSSLANWSQITNFGIEHINGTHVRLGKWMAKNIAPGTTVASFDIGGVAYFSNVPVVDLGGLINPDFTSYLYSGRAAEYLRERHIKFVVLPARYQNERPELVACGEDVGRLGLCDGESISKREIVAFSTPYDVWRRGYAATEHAEQGQAFYEISKN